jgi:hypothetical protein
VKHDFIDYTFKTHSELLVRYTGVITELSNLNVELSNVLQEEVRSRHEAWQSSPEQSVSGRDRDATFSSIQYTTEIHRLRGDIMALTGEKELIEFLVKEGVHV